jgi:hypothetical protein
MDWDKLYRREYQPPFVPSVQHLYDLANIDPQFVNEPIPKSILDDCSALKVAVEADEQPLLPTNIRQNNRWNIEVEVRAAAAASTSQVPQQQFRGFTFIGEDPIRGQ